jgi:hypothetical protein
MNCPGCTSLIPNDADSCPHCGFAIPQDASFGVPWQTATLVAAPTAEASALPPFFAVPLWKLVLMSFFTFGVYEFFWFYRNWQRIRVREQVDISPFWRAFFGVIFCHSCFKRIETYGLAMVITPSPPILLLTVLWIVVTLAWRLPDPFWLIATLSFIFLLPVQAYANRINEQKVPTHDRNARLTVWNWVGIVIGGSVFALALVGLFVSSN